jgi:exopolyphosphatase/guanosine-5'-triphosphate,3'-diphosphate pyrophosphatase
VALKMRLIQFGHTSRIDLIGMKPDRAAVIVGGLAILIALMEELGIKTMAPIEAGLRMGVLWDLQWRATKRDRREQSARSFAQRFHIDASRASRVNEMATALYAQLKPTSDALNKLLSWSCLLHEVGLTVSQSGYHKHGAYLIENADLPGFTTREQRTMSLLIVAQKGNLRKLGDALMDPDFAKAVLALRLSVMFMHSRIDVTLDGLRLRMKSRIDVEIRRDLIADHPTVSYWMQKETESWLEVGTEFTMKLT